MKRTACFAAMGCWLALAAAAPALAGLEGDYLEARTSDVYTGPCFANAEVNLDGQEAILAWHVRKGAWDGVDLAGRTVVLVVRAAYTLGDPFARERTSRAVVLVDEGANDQAREALASFVRARVPELAAQLAQVMPAQVTFEVRGPGRALLRAGDLVEVQTRPLHHGDHLCGNEEVYYPPLAPHVDAQPAVTLAHRYEGEALGARWSSPGKRSAFVGVFAE